MFNLLKKALLISFLLYLPYTTMAWGLLGHRIVGQVADSYLNAKTKIEIRKILGDETIAMSANWADFIKSDTGFKYLDPWHYINVDSNLTETTLNKYLMQDTATDAYTRLNFLVAQLKNKALPQAKKIFYLRMLIHIAGDVHQPFHVSATGDRGGNDIRIMWFNQPANMHSLWDSYLIENQQLSYTEYATAINFTTVAQRQMWQKQPISKWMYDSYVISGLLKKDITQPNQRLSYEYNFKYLKTLNTQLLIGGVHLAGLLNQIFGS